LGTRKSNQISYFCKQHFPQLSPVLFYQNDKAENSPRNRQPKRRSYSHAAKDFMNLRLRYLYAIICLHRHIGSASGIGIQNSMRSALYL
jgi:hypothetical protein